MERAVCPVLHRLAFPPRTFLSDDRSTSERGGHTMNCYYTRASAIAADKMSRGVSRSRLKYYTRFLVPRPGSAGCVYIATASEEGFCL